MLFFLLSIHKKKTQNNKKKRGGFVDGLSEEKSKVKRKKFPLRHLQKVYLVDYK